MAIPLHNTHTYPKIDTKQEQQSHAIDLEREFFSVLKTPQNRYETTTTDHTIDLERECFSYLF